jgi:uncharacterized protein (TIGR02996 family)
VTIVEDRIAEDPDDADLRRVVADWLSERGDPRGELIAAHLALEAGDERVAPTVERLERQLMPPLPPGAGVTIVWARGYWTQLRFGMADEQAALPAFRSLLAHPSARFLRDLTLGDIGPRAQEYAPFLVELPRTLRSISVGDHGRRRSETYYGWSEPALPPRVEKIRVECLVKRLAGLPTERLRALSFGDEYFSPVEELCRIPVFPVLEELEITADGSRWHYYKHHKIFDPARVPRLRKVIVHDAGDGVAMDLADSKLLGQLDEVVLHGGVADEGAERLAAVPELDRLKVLDLGGNKISDSVLDKKLRGRPFELRAGGQRWSPTGE